MDPQTILFKLRSTGSTDTTEDVRVHLRKIYNRADVKISRKRGRNENIVETSYKKKTTD